MRWTGTLLGLALAGALALAAGVARAESCGLEPGDHSFTLDWQGVTRSYDVHVPESCDASDGPVPLVLDFHGLGSNKDQQRRLSGMLEQSEDHGFLVAYPQGFNNAWNAGWCCSFLAGDGERFDDVGFSIAVADTVAAMAPVDSGRIYATGLSNGGAMSHFLACNAASVFAAAAPVSFQLSGPQFDECSPSRPIPVLAFHGLHDSILDYEGGEGFPSAPESFERWGELDRCTGSPARTIEEGKSFCEELEPCADGVAVGLCSLDVGHIAYWTEDIPVSEVAWDFLSQFELVQLPADPGAAAGLSEPPACSRSAAGATPGGGNGDGVGTGNGVGLGPPDCDVDPEGAVRTPGEGRSTRADPGSPAARGSSARSPR